jgi:hypothetical protein
MHVYALYSIVPLRDVGFQDLMTVTMKVTVFWGYDATYFSIYEGESVHGSQMDIKRKKQLIFGPGKNIYFSSTNTDTLGASKPAAQKSFDCRLSHFRTSSSTSSSSAKRLPPGWFFIGPNEWESPWAKSGL